MTLINIKQAVQLHPHNKQANAWHLDLEMSVETGENGFLKLLILNISSFPYKQIITS